MQLFGATLKLKPWSVCSVPVRAGYSVVLYPQHTAAGVGTTEGKEDTEGIAPSIHQTKSLHGRAALHPNVYRLFRSLLSPWACAEYSLP
mgnify:CR=1 FL=1